MKKNGILFLILLVNINLFSQDSVKEKTSENIILFSPFNLVDPVNPAFCLGFERYFNNRVGGLVDLGVITPNGLYAILDRQDRTRHSGYKVRGEIMFALRDINAKEIDNENRYRRLNKNIKFFPYIAVDCFYMKNSYAKNNWFYYPVGDSIQEYQDGYEVLKIKKGVNLKFGIKLHVKHFVLTVYGGLGLVNRSVIHSNRDNLSHKISADYRDPIYEVRANEIGNRTYINPVLNVKIGYSFAKLYPR